jgi:Anti-sigma-K factor rskA/Putative zinc-finger
MNPAHDCERLHEAASYALGALDERELASYEAHLATCPVCSAEILRLRPVADSLSLAVPRVEAPDDLRSRLMQVVSGEAELMNAAGWEADRPPRARSPFRRLAPALAAAAALGAGLLIGALAINTGSVRRTQVVRAIVLAPPGFHSSAALRKAGSHVELVVVGLPAPPRGRIYEVWLEHGSQPPQPTDVLFSVTHQGNGTVGVPSDLRGISHVLVTDEPFGGSPKPTRKPIIVASV